MTAPAVVWTALHTFQYGLAIAGLNGIQSVVTCGAAGGVGADNGGEGPAGWFKPCIPMTPAQFGFVVAVLTLGGLTGSLISRTLSVRYGSVGILRRSAVAVLLGSLAVASANEMMTMAVGRFLIGIGCGLATTTVPLVLRTLAPANATRALGILNQLSIVLGVVVAQALSFPLGRPTVWRGVPLVAAGVAVLQLAWSGLVAGVVRERAAQMVDGDGEGEESPLLGADSTPLTIPELVKCKELRVRRAFVLVIITQLAQQVCGVTAVMYFTTRILTPVFPQSAKGVALIVILTKVPLTIAPAFLIERLGPKPILLFPTTLMILAAVLLAISINHSLSIPAVVGLGTYVAAFSVGLGPVPWVLLGEVVPIPARAAASSLGLAVNWSTSFLVGAGFLPLQEWLSGGDPRREGTVFYLVAATCTAALVAMTAAYRSYERVG